MLRFLVTVHLAGAGGSLAATTLLVSLRGAGSDPLRFVAAFSLGTMIFAVPGAILLVGVRAYLGERRPSPLLLSGVTIAVGALVGGLMLALIFRGALMASLAGALYGLMTALALVVFDGLWFAIHRNRRASELPE